MKPARLLAITAATIFCASAWAAEQFPTKPIRFVLPQAPGGIADVICRMVAQKMSESLGQQVLIDNRPSAGAVVAAEMVAKSEPDGYTLMQTGSGTASAQTLFKKLPYSLLDDFSPVSIAKWKKVIEDAKIQRQ
jgi:tripartite-type tricarboxylate transporter receptor subunit TctC